MDPFSFLARVLALHHPIVDTPPSDSPTSTRERSNVLQQQRSHSQHHPSPSSTIATAAYAAVLKLASELLSQEPGLLEGAVEALDRAPVHRITTRQYRRELHLVKGRERLEYTVLGTRDCSCQSFQLMQCRSLRPRCKHLLAVCLAPFLGRLEEREVNDELYESYVRL
ncbi:Hypothetical protein NocV09_02200500 [Nannochloropsis oceanica]